MWTDASSALYEASYNHAYFRNITILVPTTWDHNEEYQVAYTENYDDESLPILCISYLVYKNVIEGVPRLLYCS